MPQSVGNQWKQDWQDWEKELIHNCYFNELIYLLTNYYYTFRINYKYLGIGYLTQKLGNQSKHLVTISQEGKFWEGYPSTLVHQEPQSPIICYHWSGYSSKKLCLLWKVCISKIPKCNVKQKYLRFFFTSDI